MKSNRALENLLKARSTRKKRARTATTDAAGARSRLRSHNRSEAGRNRHRQPVLEFFAVRQRTNLPNVQELRTPSSGSTTAVHLKWCPRCQWWIMRTTEESTSTLGITNQAAEAPDSHAKKFPDSHAPKNSRAHQEPGTDEKTKVLQKRQRRISLSRDHSQPGRLASAFALAD